jgi:hypothetical protein
MESRATGFPGNVSAYGVSDTLDAALEDLSEGIRAALGAGPIPVGVGPIPDELTRKIAVRVRDAA